MKLRTFATTLATAAALTLAAPAWAGYVFSFSASPNPAYVGGAVTVDVTLTNDAAGITSLGFDLWYDSSILKFQSATGGGLFADELFDAFEGTAGVVTTLVSDEFLDPMTDTGIIGTFIFLAVGDGSADLNVDVATAFATDGSLDDRTDFSNVSSSVTVLPQVVPVPGTLLLAGLGLALLGGTRWRGSPFPATR